MLLVAGGELDINLQRLWMAVERLGVQAIDYRQPVKSSFCFHWDMFGEDSRLFEGKQPTAAFIRSDIFAYLADSREEVSQRAAGFYTAVYGWLLAHSEVRVFNRCMKSMALNKPVAQHLAREVGLLVPRTLITNDVKAMRNLPTPSVIKPVNGGGYCVTLEEGLDGQDVDFAAMPAIVQPRLVAPEVRIFVIGESVFAFEMQSPSLDYREHQDAKVIPIDAPSSAVAGVKRLMEVFSMDFGAADLKTDPITGDLLFLELNTSPMFAAFDMAVEGRLCETMVNELLGKS